MLSQHIQYLNGLSAQKENYAMRDSLLIKNENHYSTTILTMNGGLKLFFKDYAPIRYYSLQDYKKDVGVS